MARPGPLDHRPDVSEGHREFLLLVRRHPRDDLVSVRVRVRSRPATGLAMEVTSPPEASDHAVEPRLPAPRGPRGLDRRQRVAHVAAGGCGARPHLVGDRLGLALTRRDPPQLGQEVCCLARLLGLAGAGKLGR